jgi:hypothetical protein
MQLVLANCCDIVNVSIEVKHPVTEEGIRCLKVQPRSWY